MSLGARRPSRLADRHCSVCTPRRLGPASNADLFPTLAPSAVGNTGRSTSSMLIGLPKSPFPRGSSPLISLSSSGLVWLERVLKKILLHHRFNELTDEFTNAHVPELCL